MDHNKPYDRIDRVNNQILDILGDILIKHIDLSYLGFVTFTKIDTALATVDNRRAALGAVSNRFDHIVDNLQNVIMNTVQSQSRIVDADFSVETTNLTRNTVLQQAATSMLAQANAQKNSVLTLIQQ